jgi:hypothetical protein
MQTWTFWIEHPDGSRSVYIAAASGNDLDEARTKALAVARRGWGLPKNQELYVLGVAEGDVNIIEWNE